MTIRRPKQLFSNDRARSYVLLAAVLLLAFVARADSNWQSGMTFHTILEVMATLLASIVGVLALVRFYSRRNNTILFIGAGFLGTALLDGYHAVVTSAYFKPMMPSDLPTLIPWSWVASRFFLSVLLYLSYLAWRREQRLGVAGRISERMVYSLVGVLTVASFLFFAFVPLPPAYYPEFILHRPEELLPALFFALALIGYLRKGNWIFDDIEHWVVMALIVSCVGQIVFMPVSHTLFDMPFDAAHILKKVSYLFVLTGLLISMYADFRKVEESGARIRAVVDNLADGVVTIAGDGTVQSFNAAAERMFGYSVRETIGRNVKMLMPEPYHGEHDDYLANYQRYGIAKIVGLGREVRGRRKNGEAFTMDLAVSEINIGNRVSYVGICRDISEQKRVESFATRMGRILEDSSDEIYIFKSDTLLFVQVNGGACANLGYSAEELMNLTPVDIKPEHTAEEFLEIIEPLRNGNTDQQVFESIHERKDGSTYPVEVRLQYYRGEESPVFLAIVQDITERKKIDLMKTEFVSIVSHELRTPLTSVMGSLGLIRGGRLGDLPDQMSSLIDIAYTNSERLVRFISDILDIQKIESGNMVFRKQPLDLIALVSQAVLENEGFGRKYDVAFVFRPEMSVAMVDADEDRLMQVLTNLLSNAAKYSPPNGAVVVKVSDKGDMLRVSVTDRGPGIPEDFHDRIFQQFAQADGTDSRAKSGTGLGLSICQAIVAKHDGQIGFETEPGSGATFYFDLPESNSQARPSRHAQEREFAQTTVL